MLDSVAGEDFDTSIVKEDGKMDSDFARGVAQNFFDTFIEAKQFRCRVQACLGGEPWIEFTFSAGKRGGRSGSVGDHVDHYRLFIWAWMPEGLRITLW